MNFEVYGQNSPITPEAGEKKAPFYFKEERIELSIGIMI